MFNYRSFAAILSTSALSVILSGFNAYALPPDTRGPAGIDPNAYSPQNGLIGATESVQAAGNYGQGITVGVVDTGITSSWLGFKDGYNGDRNNGGIIAYNNCIVPCTQGEINSGNTDDAGFGHGTFVSSLITGSYPAYKRRGVAPAANIAMSRVYGGPNGGTVNAFSAGIRDVVAHGATIVNISSGAPDSAFYNYLAGTINDVASRGAIIVFSAGNDSKPFAGGKNMTGFSDQALQRMIIVGSTNENHRMSTFSNMPSNVKFTSTSGKTYYARDMWLMADGENIWGASNENDFGTYWKWKQANGTSFSAPQVSGAAALLASRWPVLMRNGTLTQLLFNTATKYSQFGYGSTIRQGWWEKLSDSPYDYGKGYINLLAAMSPQGSVRYLQSPTRSFVTTRAATPQIYAGGAVGSMRAVTAKLATTTVFDSYQRDFTQNLSGYVGKAPLHSAVYNESIAPRSFVKSARLSDNGQLSFGSSGKIEQLVPRGTADNRNWFMSFTDAAGVTTAGGNGFPATASFDEAMWDARSDAGQEMAGFASANSLASLANGGAFAAYGTPVMGGKARVAVAWSQTQNGDEQLTSGWSSPDAKAMQMGLSGKMTKGWNAGVTFSSLSEDHGMLGSVYDPKGPVKFGDHNNSMAVGVSSVFSLADHTDLLLNAQMARTGGVGYSDGFITDTSTIYSRSFGVSLAQREVLHDGDRFAFSVTRPMRVFSGSAGFSSTGVDGEGSPVFSTSRVGLAPNGNELDFGATYMVPVRENLRYDLSVTESRDAQNIAGSNDLTGLVKMHLNF